MLRAADGGVRARFAGMPAGRRLRFALAAAALLAAASAVAVANVALLSVASSPSDDVGSLSARLDLDARPAASGAVTPAGAAADAPAARPSVDSAAATATVTDDDGDHGSDD